MAEKSRTLGHIFGQDLNEMKFVCDSQDSEGNPTSVELGEMLITEDTVTRERFLMGVRNVGYGQNPDWSKEIARSYNRSLEEGDVRDEHANPRDAYQANRRHQLFLEASCELLGYINKEGKFLTPKRLPSYFSPVRAPLEEDLEFMRQYMGDIKFGKFRSGSTVLDVEVGLFGELLPKHIGVFAQTGGGKSNTMQVLIGAVMEQQGKYGMLLFEPHGEYIHNLKRHPLASQQLVCFSQDGKEGRKVRISYSEMTVGSLMNVRGQMKWTEAQERFMREAESKYGNDWFRFVVETPSNLDEAAMLGVPVTTTLKDEFPNTFEDTIKVAKSKLQQIQKAPYLVRDDTVSDSDEIMAMLDEGKVVLIDMASLSGLYELLLSTILSSKLLSRRRRAYVKDREKFKTLPPVSVVLEEAQRVLGKEGNSDSNVFAQICNEGRKFLTGVIAITQQPKLMDPILISQFNTLIILSISDETDFKILSGISKKPLKKLQTEICSLMPGEAIVTSPLSPFALPVKVHFYEDYIKTVKKAVSRTTPKPSSFGGMV